MKTIKFKVYASISLVGCKREDILEIEVEDDATDEEIEREVNYATKEWAYEQFEWYYEIEGS